MEASLHGPSLTFGATAGAVAERRGRRARAARGGPVAVERGCERPLSCDEVTCLISSGDSFLENGFRLSS